MTLLEDFEELLRVLLKEDDEELENLGRGLKLLYPPPNLLSRENLLPDTALTSESSSEKGAV